jgi:hypothetical protein
MAEYELEHGDIYHAQTSVEYVLNYYPHNYRANYAMVKMLQCHCENFVGYGDPASEYVAFTKSLRSDNHERLNEMQNKIDLIK